MKYLGLLLAALVLIGWLVSLGVMANYFFKKSLRPGGGFFFIVYMFAGAFTFLGAELLIIFINYLTGFAVLL